MKTLAAALAFRLLLLGNHSYAPAPDEIPAPAVPETEIAETVLLNTMTAIVQRHPDDPAEPYRLTCTLPQTWTWSPSNIAVDAEAIAAGRYCVKRLEVFPYLRETPFKGYSEISVPQKESRTLPDGTEYLSYTSLDSTEIGTPVCRYVYNLHISSENAYLTMIFNTYEDTDPADYFNTHIQPILDSIQIQ